MSIKFAFVMFALLIAVTVQLMFTDAAVYSQDRYMAMKAVQLQHQLEALQHMEKAELQKKCLDATGNHKAALDAEHARTGAELCIKLTVNQAVMDGMSRSNQWNYYYRTKEESPMLNAIKSVCVKKADLVQCQNNYVNVVKVCYDEKDKKKLEKSREAFESFLDYICYNNAERISSFTENGGLACFQQNLEPIAECAVNLSNDVASIINPTALVNSNFDEVAGCKTASTFFNCFVDKLKSCSNKTPANVVDGLFKHILKSECDETEHTGKNVVTVV